MSLRRITLGIDGDIPSDHPLRLESEEARHALERHGVCSLAKDDVGFDLELSTNETHLVIGIRAVTGESLAGWAVAMTPYRRLIQDYFTLLGSYGFMAENGSPYQLETVDMGRRAIHDEAADLLIDRLKDRLIMDHPTARRLFTLICALHLGRTRLYHLAL